MHYQGENQHIRYFILLFSFFAILGTYSGLPVTDIGFQETPWIHDISGWEAIANARTIGVVIAGLFGGVRAGFSVGLIAGIHRYLLGGFVALPTMIAPIIQGIFAGLMKNALKKRYRHMSSVQMSFLVGFLAEAIQMLLILLLAHPFDKALHLVLLIGIPQIFSNSLGVAAFFVVLIQVALEEERIGAHSAQKALQIAERTLSSWRKPINEAVEEIGQALIQETEAVGITFREEQTILFKKGELTPFGVELPIEYGRHKAGSFHLFYQKERDCKSAEVIAILKGLGQLFSQQYALAESERQAHLVTKAEIKAMQAQMDPHFLFNVLNTVKSLIRTAPDESRKMITQLAKYLRKNMQNVNQDLIPIREELDHVQIYLDLVKARLAGRMQIKWNIEEECLGYSIPSLTVQPLVENAIVHGIRKMSSNGILEISVTRIDEGVLISVRDNGNGMDGELIQEHRQDHMGFALNNIQQRLFYHFGSEADFTIHSQKGRGTFVSFIRPIRD